MKIANYSFSLASERELEINYSKNETLQQWRDAKPNPGGGTTLQDELNKLLHDQLDISAQAKEALKNQMCQNAKNIETNDVLPLSDQDDRKIMLLEKLLSAITGRKIKLHIPKVRMHNSQNPQTIGINPPDSFKGKASSTPPRQGWGLIYQRQETYQESEKLSFAAQGIVKTADGKEIHLDVQLNMSREFFTNNNITIKGGDALIDPLVINFDGKAAELTNTKYSFDLDSDGTADQVSFLKEGSGFLVLDVNMDGIINNGTELFGPSSGNGFQELAKYDMDNNGWIDENDTIFDKLRIWTKDESGNDQLFALGQKGIGAIFLGNVSARFNLTDQNNETLGVAQKAGVFLRENGTAGTVQQIDLVV